LGGKGLIKGIFDRRLNCNNSYFDDLPAADFELSYLNPGRTSILIPRSGVVQGHGDETTLILVVVTGHNKIVFDNSQIKNNRGKQGWGSGKSARLSPMWPGFDSSPVPYVG